MQTPRVLKTETAYMGYMFEDSPNKENFFFSFCLLNHVRVSRVKKKTVVITVIVITVYFLVVMVVAICFFIQHKRQNFHWPWGQWKPSVQGSWSHRSFCQVPHDFSTISQSYNSSPLPSVSDLDVLRAMKCPQPSKSVGHDDIPAFATQGCYVFTPIPEFICSLS